MSDYLPLLWGVFISAVSGLLYLDLRVFQRRAHVPTLKEALLWSLVWVGIALTFNSGIFFFRGSEKALEFFTGYLIELSLSVDNLFVFLLIFSYFSVPAKYEHRVLFWGILGAVLMRGGFILAGVTLMELFHWVIYVFGAFLIFSGVKIGFRKTDSSIHPDKNPVFRLFRKFIPMTTRFEEGCFTVRREGRLIATPLLAVLFVIETTDIVFALDSVPAILAITTDPFIVYTSNIFAILGLRAFFFALAGVMRLFRFIQYGLSFILVYIGLKMVVSELYPIPVFVSLLVILCTLALSILASILIPHRVDMAMEPENAAGEKDLAGKKHHKRIDDV